MTQSLLEKGLGVTVLTNGRSGVSLERVTLRKECINLTLSLSQLKPVIQAISNAYATVDYANRAWAVIIVLYPVPSV